MGDVLNFEKGLYQKVCLLLSLLGYPANTHSLK